MKDTKDSLKALTLKNNNDMATENKNLSALLNPLSKDNPVIVQILGICSCLAVTAKLEPAFVMGISVIAVLAFANVIISL